MCETIENVWKTIEEEEAKFVRLVFRDAFGTQKNVSVMPGEIRKAFDRGIPFNVRSVSGFEESRHALLYLKPDPETLTVLPWRPDRGRVLRMYCDVCTPEGEACQADTRTILKQAVRQAEEAGVIFRFGTEMEFYLFRKDEEGNPTDVPFDQAGYMDIAPADRCENIRREICLTIEQMGLTPERSHHERGPGQNEIDFHYAKPLKAADQITSFKMAVGAIADRHGLTADFSPVPIPGKPGNGYHIHMYAEDTAGQDLAAYAAAGVLKRIRDITLFLNPAESSYARLGNHAAPDHVDWDDAGRSRLMNLESYMGKTNAELRSPDASGNPYLVYALLIYAGLEGIENKMMLPDPMSGSCPPLPGSRREAGSMAGESDFVRRVLPAEVIRAYRRA